MMTYIQVNASRVKLKTTFISATKLFQLLTLYTNGGTNRANRIDSN